MPHQPFYFMMTLSNGNIFRVASPFWEKSTGPRWISFTKGSGAVFFDLRLNKRLSKLNYRDTGDLRRHRARYDVTVISHDKFPEAPLLTEIIWN